MRLKLYGILFVLFCATSLSAQLTMQKCDDGILIVDGAKKVLKYQADPLHREGSYERCNYIHPLWGLDGTVLTEDFPADHLHHRGVFWAWHQVWINGKRIGDSWEIKDFDQNVVELEFLKQSNGSVQIKTEVDWSSGKWKKGGIRIPYMKEKALITVHPLSSNVRKIDFEIKLLALEDNLSIGGSEDRKGYGGFSVRLDIPEDVMFYGAEGPVEPENTAVQSEQFINVTGAFGVHNRKAGVAIVDNPQNPGYPQAWILRNKNSMQNAVWPGSEAVAVSRTEPVVLKYSLLIYSGKLSAKKIERLVN